MPATFRANSFSPVDGAAVGDFDGVGELEDGVVEGILWGFGKLVGYGLVDQGAGAVAIAAEDAAERMGGDDEPAGGGGGLAQLCGLVEAGLVFVEAESEHVAHVGLHFHGANQDHAMESGELLKLVAVPWPGVLRDAEAPQAQPIGFQHHIFGSQATVATAFGGVDMQVKKSGHLAAIPP